MKLSKETNDILKNFASINMSIAVKQGSLLRTVSPQKTVLAAANIKEQFPKEFAVYDLNQLLATMSLFDDPDLDFTDKSIKISNGSSSKVTFTYASKEAIISAPDKDIKLPTEDVAFRLEEKSLTAALRAAGVLALPEIILVGREGNSYITAGDSHNDSAHKFEHLVGKSTNNYSMIFRLDNLKMLPRDYDVVISKNGISRFKSATSDVTYYVATETGSKYDSE